MRHHWKKLLQRCPHPITPAAGRNVIHEVDREAFFRLQTSIKIIYIINFRLVIQLQRSQFYFIISAEWSAERSTERLSKRSIERTTQVNINHLCCSMTLVTFYIIELRSSIKGIMEPVMFSSLHDPVPRLRTLQD